MQAANNTPHASSLAQVVCEWSPTKLSELAKSFSDSCSPPEVTFSSYDSYKAYFEPLLLAEVAAELLSAKEKFQRSAPARLSKVRARREEPGTTTALVAVQKVTRHHSLGFGWAVDLESQDRKGPVGAVDSDVVAVWPCDPEQPQSRKGPNRSSSRASRVIPNTAVCAVVNRPLGRNGCRVVLSKFPDGNEAGVRTDLEEGEENEEEPPPLRLWKVLRLGTLTTMRREFDALINIKASVLLPILLRPKTLSGNTTAREWQDSGASPDNPDRDTPSANGTEGPAKPVFRSEEMFTNVIANKTGLNSSQARAILHASTCRNGFAVIQGPPGTGKTRTLIALLNVIHMTQYQQYYESCLGDYENTTGGVAQARSKELGKAGASRGTSNRSGNGSLLQGMMVAMNKTTSTSTSEQNRTTPSRRNRRPRLLVCAPSNSAVDEILTRLARSKFIDGHGRLYCPELARIGAGDRVSESAKPFTAEGQAEAFLDRLGGEDMAPEAQKKAEKAFMISWQSRVNALLVQLSRTQKWKPSSRSVTIELIEKLERMERDLRRLSIAASDGSKSMSREEKLRQIARTYVEDAQLVFATLSGSASSILTKKTSFDSAGADGTLFDTVVIDEGAQATEPSCLIPMTLGASRCLLVGDPQQLPATVLSSGAAGLAYGQSLLERVCRAGKGVQLLDTQYRMHPAISSFPRRYFYNGRLVDDESVQGENRARPYHRDHLRPKLGPYVFLDIAEGEEQRSRDDRSIFNRAEAELAALIYSKLKKEYPKDSLFSSAAKLPGSVTGFGVVTPYKRQMQELRQSFDRAGVPTGDVEIDTVDSFQGREKDFVVFSCVRTAAEHRGIGFVRDVRRMNVGLTRARSSLIILGSARALAEGSQDWAELVEDATSRGCLISVANVHRCLNPVPERFQRIASGQAGSRSVEKDGRKSTALALKAARPAPGQRRVHGSGRVDPRLRAMKRESPADKDKVDVPVASRQRHLGSSNVEEAKSAVPLVSQKHEAQIQSVLGAAQRRAPALQGTNGTHLLMKHVAGSEEKAVALQATLEPMIKLLTDAGLKNPKLTEHALREHVLNGGSLDLEVVMAAAFAASAALNETRAEDEEPHGNQAENPTGTEVKPDSTPAPIGGSGEQLASRGRVPVEEKDPVRTASRGGDKRKAVSSEHGVKAKGSNDRDRSFKTNPKERASAKKRGRSDAREPSGWDMLFASQKASSSEKPLGSNEDNRNGDISEAQTSKAKDHDVTVVNGKKANGRAASTTNRDPAVSDGIEGQAGSRSLGSERQNEQLSSGDAKSTADEPNSASAGPNRLKKQWIEKPRDFDRKRPRGPEYGRGGARNERGRNFPKRSRGRGSFQENPHRSRYNKREEGWGQEQFDSAYGQYPMMGNGYDQGMNSGSHHMIPMQGIPQQAMQQQAMHQQMMQPGYQTLAYQHPAYQSQLLQQHIHQQEAYRQAVMHSYNTTGTPTGAVGSHPYAGGEPESFNPGSHRNTAPNQRGSNWNSNAGRGRAGRGRGRSKYGGRGR